MPFGPLIDLLQTADLAASQSLRESSPLARLLPGLAAPLPAGEPEVEKRRLHEALAALLGIGVAPEAQPRVIWIEDAHWADDASLDFLLCAARRISSHPVILAITYRNEEIGANLERFLAALDRERLAREIALRRLDARESAELIQSVFGLPTRPHPEFVTLIHTLTDGNPTFVEEMLKSLVMSGDVFALANQWGRKPVS